MRRPGRMSPPARLYAPASLRARITGRQGRAQSLRCRATTSLAEKKPKKSSTGPKRPAGPPADPRPLLFVVLLGLSGEPLRVRCETIARLVRLRATEPLFLVDDDTSLAYFRRRCLLFEFVPPARNAGTCFAVAAMGSLRPAPGEALAREMAAGRGHGAVPNRRRVRGPDARRSSVPDAPRGEAPPQRAPAHSAHVSIKIGRRARRPRATKPRRRRPDVVLYLVEHKFHQALDR